MLWLNRKDVKGNWKREIIEKLKILKIASNMIVDD